MRNRILAALILTSLFCWSALPAMASPGQDRPVPAKNSPSHSVRNHSCCPGSHTQLAPAVLLTMPPANMPCGDRPCCARQGPENSPTLPALKGISRPDSKQIHVGSDLRDQAGRELIQAESSFRNAFEFYSVRSTILRN